MTKIEWASLGLPKGVTWNPIRARHSETGKRGWHCEKVSPACEHCYAETLNMKAGDTGGTGLLYKPGHRGDVEIYLDEKTLLATLSWRAPRGVFVASMTDIFGDWVPDEWLDRIFAVMALCPQHRFAVLTKRPKRMREWIEGNSYRSPSMPDIVCEEIAKISGRDPRESLSSDTPKWPLPNAWLGVTAEDQTRADERIPDLLSTPAAVRFVSVEPMLGKIDLTSVAFDLGQYDGPDIGIDALKGERWAAGIGCSSLDIGAKLNWVIVGGESGKDARPMHPDWAPALRDQCKAAGVPFFFKQWGEWREIEPGDTFDTAHGRAGRPPAFIIKPDGTVHCFMPDNDSGARAVIRVGKKRAGRLLDGVEYSEFPEAR